MVRYILECGTPNKGILPCVCVHTRKSKGVIVWHITSTVENESVFSYLTDKLRP